MSRASNARPATTGMPSVAKKSAVTSCALIRSAGVASSATVRTETGPPLDSGGDVPAATRWTPGSAAIAPASCRVNALRFAPESYSSTGSARLAMVRLVVSKPSG